MVVVSSFLVREDIERWVSTLRETKTVPGRKEVDFWNNWKFINIWYFQK